MQTDSVHSLGESRMESDLVFGDLMSPSVVRPVQFQDIWHRSRARTSEQQLALAVLQQAVLDLQKFRYARRPRRQRLYMEAYQWVAADDFIWPFSFVNICHMLNLSPEALRAELLKDVAPAKLRQAA